jgi:glucose-6-phosphate 1-dehydrogenase
MTDIVLFGVTGDLARHKILPALAQISSTEPIRLVGFGRKKMVEAQFRSYLEECALAAGKTFYDKNFSCVYVYSEISDPEGFKQLGHVLIEDALIYIALPPEYQLPVSRLLIQEGVLHREKNRKIAFEKPYGSNSKEAKKLDVFLLSQLQENQVIRVDHYIGKKTLHDLESIGTLGFGSFVQSLAKLKKVEISFKEKITVDMRGAFYDKVGTMADVAQNHMLYMLVSFVWAQRPLNAGVFQAEDVLGIKSIIAQMCEIQRVPRLYQYNTFKNVTGVAKGSCTETYFTWTVKLQNPEGIKLFRSKKTTKEAKGIIAYLYSVFKNVPIVFTGGKGLSKNDVSITAQYGDKLFKLPINKVGDPDAYETVLLLLIKSKIDCFISIEQILAGWNLVESAKKKTLRGKVVEYSVGTEPTA